MKCKLLFCIALIMLIAGCRKEFGEIIIEERTAAPFHTIILYSNIDLVLTQDATNSIKVKAGSRSISSVRTEIRDSILTIENTNDNIINSPGNKIEVNVSVNDLRNIDYRGAGTVTGTNVLETSVFTIVSSVGAGNVNLDVNADHLVAGIYEDNADFILKGKSNTAFVYCSPRGTMDLRDMEVKKMSLVHSSVRNAYVFVTEELNGSIYHTGNVFYKGNPVVNKQEMSTGKFYPL